MSKPRRTGSRSGGSPSAGDGAFGALLSSLNAVGPKVGDEFDWTSNGDETEYADKSATFSKGLLQQAPGRVDPGAFRAFRNELDRAEPVAPPRVGGVEMRAPLCPPPPRTKSREYAAELVELYWASLLRDRPFSLYDGEVTAIAAARELDGLGDAYRGPRDSDGHVTTRTLFRGGMQRDGKVWFAGETFGPYVSQFLLQSARIGAQTLDRKFQVHRAGLDYLVEESDWAWAQNGGLPHQRTQVDPIRRHLKDGRGLASCAYADEVIQSYFVAHRVMVEIGVPANPGSPHAAQLSRRPISTFDAPDFVGSLNALARAALAAVKRQVWNVHLRPRPEAGGGLVHIAATHRASTILRRASGGVDELHPIVMSSPAVKLSYMKHGSYLLSQAWPEGAPAHPAYPSDRAVIAGACVTVLKTIYDCERPFTAHARALEASPDGLTLQAYSGVDAAQMTINSELSKLAHNVAFGHGLHAGANWRSDVDEGLLFGEAFAIAWLKAQAQQDPERRALKIRRFDGEWETIGN